MQPNTLKAIEKLKALKLHIRDTQDFMEYEASTIQDIINLLTNK